MWESFVRFLDLPMAYGLAKPHSNSVSASRGRFVAHQLESSSRINCTTSLAYHAKYASVKPVIATISA